jgi:hypothetical protein
MLKLFGLITWIAIVIPGLSSFYKQLNPSWYRQTKGLPLGAWLCLDLLGLSVVPLLLTLSFIEGRLIQR